MASSFAWERKQFFLDTSSDGEGWFATDGYLVAAPLSLLRVVLRADCRARIEPGIFLTKRPMTGGLVRLQLSITDDDGTRQYYGASRGLRVVTANGPPDTSGNYVREANGWVDRWEVDLQIRRAAPAPPANAMILTWYWNFTPDPFQPGPEWDRFTHFTGDLDLLYLTSQPSI